MEMEDTLSLFLWKEMACRVLGDDDSPLDPQELIEGGQENGGVRRGGGGGLAGGIGLDGVGAVSATRHRHGGDEEERGVAQAEHGT